MADPLSVLGAAVGVTSLIIQLTDECVKGIEVETQKIPMENQNQNQLISRRL
jgi:hypothetical protein